MDLMLCFIRLYGLPQFSWSSHCLYLISLSRYEWTAPPPHSLLTDSVDGMVSMPIIWCHFLLSFWCATWSHAGHMCTNYVDLLLRTQILWCEYFSNVIYYEKHKVDHKVLYGKLIFFYYDNNTIIIHTLNCVICPCACWFGQRHGHLHAQKPRLD